MVRDRNNPPTEKSSANFWPKRSDFCAFRFQRPKLKHVFPVGLEWSVLKFIFGETSIIDFLEVDPLATAQIAQGS